MSRCLDCRYKLQGGECQRCARQRAEDEVDRLRTLAKNLDRFIALIMADKDAGIPSLTAKNARLITEIDRLTEQVKHQKANNEALSDDAANVLRERDEARAALRRLSDAVEKSVSDMCEANDCGWPDELEVALNEARAALEPLPEPPERED